MTSWRDNLLQLKKELADFRTRRRETLEAEKSELAQERDGLANLALSLGIVEMLTDMNGTLLDSQGEVETIVGWEIGGPEDPLPPAIVDLASPEDLEEPADAITTVLSWEEGNEMEIVVDLGISDEGTYMHVNGIEVLPERDALEQALIEAFQDELSL